MEIKTFSTPLAGIVSLLLIVMTIKLMARNRAAPTKISNFRENIKSVYDYFFQNINTIEDFPAAESNR